MCALLLFAFFDLGSGLTSTVRAEQPASAPFKCVQQPTLIRTAARLASNATQRIGPSAEALDAVELVRIARSEGSDAVPIQARFGAADDLASFRKWLGALHRSHDGPIGCGWVTHGDRTVLVAGGQAGGLDILGRNRIRVSTHKTFEKPYLVVSALTGAPRRVQVNASNGNSTILIPPEWGRPILIQLVAVNDKGPRPIAERWLGGVPEAEATTQRAKYPPAWLDSLRHSADVLPVRRNELLSTEAGAHAKTICGSGRVAHQLELGEDPEARLKARGVHARVVGEAVARAKDMGAALSAIEQSPSHRMTMIDSRYTDAGFGAASDDRGRTCVVVMLASWPRVVR